jgi:redox-sensitive bicupin YhaK (pirin superfamily)
MSIYRVYAGADGESHIEEIHLEKHPELGALMNVAQVGIHEFPQRRTMDFHPLTERRLIIHLRGEVEIGVSDGGKQIFRPGDARLMEDTSGRGHTHQDLSPVIQAVVVLKD